MNPDIRYSIMPTQGKPEEDKSVRRFDVPRYYRVACCFWDDEKVTQWPDWYKTLALYVLTTKHRTLEGFYVLPPQYIAADLRWPLKRVLKGLAYLSEQEFISFDSQTNLLLITNALRFQQPDSLNVQKAVIGRVKRLPDNLGMLSKFISLAKMHCNRSGLSPYAQGLAAQLEKEFASGNRLSSEPLSNESMNDGRTPVRRASGARPNS